jgi:hypothetical protein
MSRHTKAVTGLTYSLDGQLISFSEDQTIRLWDVKMDYV